MNDGDYDWSIFWMAVAVVLGVIIFAVICSSLSFLNR